MVKPFDKSACCHIIRQSENGLVYFTFAGKVSYKNWSQSEFRAELQTTTAKTDCRI